jgi:hypothetical protein
MQTTLIINKVAKLRLELTEQKTIGNLDAAAKISYQMFRLMADAIRAKKKLSL